MVEEVHGSRGDVLKTVRAEHVLVVQAVVVGHVGAVVADTGW